MILFTQREKQVIIFLICTLVGGYAVKHYKQAHLYDDFNPLSKVEKEGFKETAELIYKQLDRTDKAGLEQEPNRSSEKKYKPIIEIININTADKQDLIKLPKIGAVTAEWIIRFRDDFGSFETLDDLMKIKGIGRKNSGKTKTSHHFMNGVPWN